MARLEIRTCCWVFWANTTCRTSYLGLRGLQSETDFDCNSSSYLVTVTESSIKGICGGGCGVEGGLALSLNYYFSIMYGPTSYIYLRSEGLLPRLKKTSLSDAGAA